jgi:hypothetical protein
MGSMRSAPPKYRRSFAEVELHFGICNSLCCCGLRQHRRSCRSLTVSSVLARASARTRTRKEDLENFGNFGGNVASGDFT